LHRYIDKATNTRAAYVPGLNLQYSDTITSSDRTCQFFHFQDSPDLKHLRFIIGNIPAQE